MVGLGRMGANMARRLMRDGHRIVAFDVSPDAVAALAKDGARGRLLAGGPGLEARRAPLGLGDGSGRRDHREDDRGPRRGARARRRDRRRRQLLLPRRHPPRRGAAREGDRLRRLRDQRRRLRPRARLLPDDRRPRRGGRAPRPGLRDAGPRGRGGRAHAGSLRRRDPGRERLPALRPQRRRPLREDGPQRNRVRDDGRLRRGPQHPRERERRQGRARGRRRDRAARSARVLPVRPRPARGRRGLAARQRDRLLAARPDRRGDAGIAGPLRVQRSGLRLGRGPLDLDRGDRRGRAGAGADRGSLRALLLARPGRFRRQGPLGHAQAVRRSRREEARR